MIEIWNFTNGDERFCVIVLDGEILRDDAGNMVFCTDGSNGVILADALARRAGQPRAPRREQGDFTSWMAAQPKRA